MFGFLKRIFGGSGRGANLREAAFVVTINANQVLCRRPNGKEESVRWADLSAVIIETNDTGPLGADLYWVLLGRGGKSGCVIPMGATGEEALVQRLQDLPGFDHEAMLAAMGSVENQSYLCWKGEGFERE